MVKLKFVGRTFDHKSIFIQYFLYLEPSKKIDNLLMILCNHKISLFFVKYIRDVRISLSVLTISRFSKNPFYFEKGYHVFIRKQFVTTKGVLK